MRLKKIFIIICALQITFYACILSSCIPSKIVHGTVFYNNNEVDCTKKECLCCNSCSSRILLITGSDTLQLCGTVKDTAISCGTICDTTIHVLKNAKLLCKGKDCNELNCSPFVNNKQYEIVGRFLHDGKNERYANFKVIKFKEKVETLKM